MRYDITTYKYKQGDPITEDCDGQMVFVSPEHVEGEDTRAASMQELTELMYQLTARKKELEATLDIIGSNLDAVSLRLGEVMAEQGTLPFKIAAEDGAQVNFKLGSDTYASIKSDRKEEAYAFLVKLGFGGMLQTTVHPRTLSSQLSKYVESEGETGPLSVTAFVRERTAELDRLVQMAEATQLSDELPPELFSIHTVDRAKITKIS